MQNTLAVANLFMLQDRATEVNLQHNKYSPPPQAKLSAVCSCSVAQAELRGEAFLKLPQPYGSKGCLSHGEQCGNPKSHWILTKSVGTTK